MNTFPYIPRPVYTEKIKPFIGKQIIKILTGQRRVGKSYIMYQLMDYIRLNDHQANIIYINREFEEFNSLRTHTELTDYLKKEIIPENKNYLFIDEVQEITEFQYTLRDLLAKNACDIFCTGSNARMLSSELATSLAGRYIEFNIHSLNYQEFLLFHQLSDTDENLLKFLTYGGMPYLINIGLKNNLPFEYLRNVYSTILLKDIIARENIRNVSFLENLVHYLANNIGNLFSANNISKFLKSQKIEISTQLTINYLKAISNAYLIHKVPRADIKGLRIFEIGEKYYFEDIGLRNAIHGFNRQTDIACIMENVVYSHLLAQNYRIFVGKYNQQEIDFMAEKDGNRLYCQVCLQLAGSTTYQREFGNLLEIKDNYPKYVVTLNDPLIGNDYHGIRQLNLREFLKMSL